MEKILIGIDEEPTSQAAVNWVIARAQQTPTHVTLLAGSGLGSKIELTLADAARQRILKATPNSTVDRVATDVSLSEELISRSATADLLVIGSDPHRLSGASLPAALIRHSLCPVVVVPDDWGANGSTVLLAVDDDDSSDSAVAFAVGQAEASSAELVVVHAWQMPGLGLDPLASVALDPEVVEQQHRNLLAAVLNGIQVQHPQLHVRAVTGRGPVDLVVKAELADTALLVLGTHGHGPVLDAVLGSTVHHFLRHGEVPVAVVRNGVTLSTS